MSELEKTVWESDDGELGVHAYTRNGVAYVGIYDGEYNYIEIDCRDVDRVVDAIRDAVAKAQAWVKAKEDKA
jgi:hypothetical protein